MTENEAIDVIHDKIETCEFYFAENDRYPNWCEYEFVEALGIAISTLEEVQQYREIGTVEECREAREKQKAKKLDIYTDTRNMVDLHGNVYLEEANVYLCPTCGSFIGYVGNNIFHYCPVCGQAIDG